jgi:hypothetical protein
MNTVYRASTLKRIRRTNDQIELLDQQIFDVLEADHPQSVRHVFYRMAEASEKAGLKALAERAAS